MRTARIWEPDEPAFPLKHFSVSQLRTFLTCPRRHSYRYVDAVEAEYRAASLAFGTAWHATIARVLRGLSGGVPSLTEIWQWFEEALRVEVEGEGDDDAPVLFDTEEQGFAALVEKGRRMLNAFLDQVDWPDRVLDVELPFSLVLHHPRTGAALPLPFVGSLDAWVEQGNSAVVWELKTAARRWSKSQLAHDSQAVAYRMATASMGRESLVRVLVTTKTAAPELQVETPIVRPEDARELASVAFSVHRALTAGVDHPVRGWHCGGCPYRGRCGR